jgi:hypothetical protein
MLYGQYELFMIGIKSKNLSFCNVRRGAIFQVYNTIFKH